MVQTTIRLDEELYEKLVRLANKEKRSINAEFNFILEKYFKIIKDL